MKIFRAIISALLAVGITASACGCSAIKGITGGETLRILSGSENEALEQILEDCERTTGVKIEMTYKGSVDIMRELKNGAPGYDAVWTASSLWLSLGDERHIVKHDESICTTPVIFGIKQSVAEKLGFTDGEASVKDILSVIEDDKLTFCMTSATQSNSGASAYIGFLYALLGKTYALTNDDLADPELREQITKLLSGVERSSGSSGWLEDMFLAGDYDAMVNYECLIIDANRQLAQTDREPLYAVYPYDGLSIADSPLGYLDHGSEKKEEAFLKVQDYLLSDKAQTAIEATGRRISLNGVSEQNKDVFNASWGIDVNRILSPITMPSADVLMNALNLWQSSFRKPSLTVYCLDFSGSMEGDGNSQLLSAMQQVLVEEYAEANLLQAADGDVNIVVTFDSDIMNVYTSDGSDAESLRALYENVRREQIGGGTDIYKPAQYAVDLIHENYNASAYTAAVILMTDGASETYSKDDFKNFYLENGGDIPVFSIMFGSAEREQLDSIARLTNARVFDGRQDLVSAFRSVKGYN
ncbi:MAG: substrate-binding domain-containing protein [Oscillospiraceae bacterium]